MAQSGPAGLTHIEGSVAFAPAGATEWSDARPRRPVTRGDRLWTDKGGRAEVQLASATLHMDSEAFVEVVALGPEFAAGEPERRHCQCARASGRRRRHLGDQYAAAGVQGAAARRLPHRRGPGAGNHAGRRAKRHGDALWRGRRRIAVAGGPAGGIQRARTEGRRPGSTAGPGLRPLGGRPQSHRGPVDCGSRAQQAQAGQQQSGSSRAMPNWVPNQHGYWEWIAPWGWTWVQPRMQAAPPQVIVRPRYPPQGGWRLN